MSLNNNNKWEKAAAGGGIAFVVLQLLGQALIQIGGAEPPFTASADEILAFFNNRDPVLAPIGGFLSILSIIAFIFFLGALWAALSRVKKDRPGCPWWQLAPASSGRPSPSAAAVGSWPSYGWKMAWTPHRP